MVDDRDPDRIRAVRRSLAALLATVAAACGAGDATEGVVERDSAGVRIVESPTAADREAGWSLSSEPTLEIGVVEGEAPYQLFRVTGVGRLGDGRIAVLNAGTAEIRFFDGRGRFLHSAGGEGDGPGELRFPQLVGIGPDDTLAVFGFMNRRISLFTGEGEFARAYTLRRPLGALAGRFLDGTLVIERSTASANPNTPEGAIEDTLHYIRYAEHGESADTLVSIPTRTLFVWTDDLRVGFTPLPFTARPSGAVHGDRLFVAMNPAPEVRVFRPDGSLERILRVRAPPEAVTRGEFREEVERQVGRARDPDQERELRSRYDRMPMPDVKPFFRTLLVDRAGRVWAERFQAGEPAERVWTVFGPDGRVIGSVGTPDGFHVHEIGGDYVLGTARDELAVERVRLYELRGG